MKKSILIVVIMILVASTLIFTGCGGAAPFQKKIGNNAPWIGNNDKVETNVYDVESKQGDSVIKGEYTFSIEYLHDTDVTVDSKTLTKFVGYRMKSQLTMENGDNIQTEILCQTTMRPMIAKSKSTIGGVEKSYIAEYGKKSVDYTLVKDGKSSDGSIKIKDYFTSPFADNTMMYMLARCLTSSLPGFTIAVPSFDNNTTNNVVCGIQTVKKDENKMDVLGQTYEFTLVELAYNRTFPGRGEPLRCYISNAPIEGTLRPILKIVEGGTTYTLKSTKTA